MKSSTAVGFVLGVCLAVSATAASLPAPDREVPGTQSDPPLFYLTQSLSALERYPIPAAQAVRIASELSPGWTLAAVSNAGVLTRVIQQGARDPETPPPVIARPNGLAGQWVVEFVRHTDGGQLVKTVIVTGASDPVELPIQRSPADISPLQFRFFDRALRRAVAGAKHSNWFDRLSVANEALHSSENAWVFRFYDVRTSPDSSRYIYHVRLSPDGTRELSNYPSATPANRNRLTFLSLVRDGVEDLKAQTQGGSPAFLFTLVVVVLLVPLLIRRTSYWSRAGVRHHEFPWKALLILSGVAWKIGQAPWWFWACAIMTIVVVFRPYLARTPEAREYPNKQFLAPFPLLVGLILASMTTFFLIDRAWTGLAPWVTWNPNLGSVFPTIQRFLTELTRPLIDFMVGTFGRHWIAVFPVQCLAFLLALIGSAVGYVAVGIGWAACTLIRWPHSPLMMPWVGLLLALPLARDYHASATFGDVIERAFAGLSIAASALWQGIRFVSRPIVFLCALLLELLVRPWTRKNAEPMQEIPMARIQSTTSAPPVRTPSQSPARYGATDQARMVLHSIHNRLTNLSQRLVNSTSLAGLAYNTVLNGFKLPLFRRGMKEVTRTIDTATEMYGAVERLGNAEHSITRQPTRHRQSDREEDLGHKVRMAQARKELRTANAPEPKHQPPGDPLIDSIITEVIGDAQLERKRGAAEATTHESLRVRCPHLTADEHARYHALVMDEWDRQHARY